MDGKLYLLLGTLLGQWECMDMYATSSPKPDPCVYPWDCMDEYGTPIPKPDPCVGIVCRDGWVCKPADLPSCTGYQYITGNCNPTPVCLPAPKVGECPEAINPKDLASLCGAMVCFEDDGCPDEKKCCNIEDCGRACVVPNIDYIHIALTNN